MPRKKNKRKEIQKAKRAAQGAAQGAVKKPVATIAHVSPGGAGLALAVLAAMRAKNNT